MWSRFREWILARFTRADGARLVSSLILATMLWGYVSLVNDPERSETFTNVQLPPVTDLPPGLVITTQLPTVSVRVTGPRSVVEDVSLADITVRLQTEDVEGPGQKTVDILVDAPDGLRKKSASPRQIQITVEESTSKQFDLTYNKEELPPSDAQVIGELSPDVSVVTVSGPRSAVDRVASVELDIEIGEHTRDFEEDFTPVARDASGAEVPEVTIQPATVRTTVSVSQRGRQILVLPRVEGSAAAGYEVANQTTSPPNVIVDGPPEALDAVLYVYTQPVNIEGATADVVQSVAIDESNLPQGVQVVDPANKQVQVIVQIQRRAEPRSLPNQAVQVVGLGSGLQAQVDPEQVSVVVEMSEQQLETLQPGDIMVSIDVTGLGPGTYTVMPTVSVPAELRWIRVDPAQTTITISQATLVEGEPSYASTPPSDLPSGEEASPAPSPT